ncbi:MAG TPA: hypothetical protein VI957_00825 [Candidatus Paceibacterota bacterium]
MAGGNGKLEGRFHVVPGGRGNDRRGSGSRGGGDGENHDIPPIQNESRILFVRNVSRDAKRLGQWLKEGSPSKKAVKVSAILALVAGATFAVTARGAFIYEYTTNHEFRDKAVRAIYPDFHSSEQK